MVEMTARTLTSTILTGMLLAGLTATSAGAQEAVTYVVRDIEVAAPDGPTVDVQLDDPDFGTDRTPMRVVHGPVYTWVVPRGDSLTVRDAAMILHHNAPLRPGPGSVFVRGWQSVPVARYDTVHMALERGDRDRVVAGAAAHHYRLRAVIRRHPEQDVTSRYAYTADLWVRPDLVHSWAPFGYGTRSLPRVAPRLREALDRRLGDLGLVARSILHVEYSRTGVSGPTRRTSAFEISGLQPADPPPSPGSVVDQSLIERLRAEVRSDPARSCLALGRGEIPEGVDVAEDVPFPVLAQVSEGCSSRELYFTMLKDRLDQDPAPVCSAAAEAEDPAALAEAVFTTPQRTAFMELLSATDRRRFHVELRRYCQQLQQTR